MEKITLKTIKLVALDMDGTLLNDEKKITPKTKECLSVLKKKGIPVVIVTGRSFEALKPYKEELGLETPVICYNGSRIVDGKTGGILKDYTLADESCRKIIEFARKEDIHVQGYKDGILYFEKTRSESDHYESHVNLKGEIINFDSLSPLNMTKMMYVGAHGKLQDAMERLEKEIGTITSIMFSNVEFLEFMRKGVSKGKALHEILSSMRLSPSEVIAFGDGDNDITLIEEAGVGVAMGNASPIIKEAADMVTLSNNEDGIAVVLKSLCG